MTSLGQLHLHGVKSIIVKAHKSGGDRWLGPSWASPNDPARSYVEIVLIGTDGGYTAITIFGEPAVELPDDVFEAELRRRGDEVAAKLNGPGDVAAAEASSSVSSGLRPQSMQRLKP